MPAVLQGRGWLWHNQGLFSTQFAAPFSGTNPLNESARSRSLKMAKTLYDKLWESHVVRTEDDGTEWFTVTTVVEDAKYLSAPFVTSTDFRKEADGTKWRPTTCSAY